MYDTYYNVNGMTMTDLLTDVDTLNVLIKKNPNGILLSKFDNINSVVRGQTLVSMLYNLCNFSWSWQRNALASTQWSRLSTAQLDKILRTNICKLLSNPAIDFMIPQ